MQQGVLLVADIGGTHARFATASVYDSTLCDIRTLRCADFESPEAAIRAYLSSVGSPRLRALCVAVAGPVIQQTVQFTNSHWTISADSLEHHFTGARAHLLNDWEAVALGLPHLSPEDKRQIGTTQPRALGPSRAYAALGAGTGLGTTGLLQYADQSIALIAEGGHSGFSPQNALQIEIAKLLLHTHPRVSNEILLSGDGVVRLYQALCQLDGLKPNSSLSSIEIGARALANQDPTCVATLEVFFEILGQVAGDLALTLGAYDGVYVGGGIAQHYAEPLLNSRFRAGFEHKHPHNGLMTAIPTYLIQHPYPALVGARGYAETLITTH